MQVDAGAIERLVEMGFPRERCKFALEKARGDEAAAIEHLLSDTPDEPAVMDLSAFEADPAPPNLVNSRPKIESDYWPAGAKPITPPTSPYSHPIDLTNSPALTPLLLENGPLDPLTAGKSFLSAEDLELNRALEMSLTSSGLEGYGGAGGGNGKRQGRSTEDSAIEDAIAMSLHEAVESINPLELYNATPTYVSAVEGLLEPTDRVRSVSAPVIIRTSHPQLTPLANYLQALFATPFWRKAILSFQPSLAANFSDLQIIEPAFDYDGYWKGTLPLPPGTLFGDKFRSHPAQQQIRIMTLQRLFVFLSESRRSFVSIDSVAKVLLGESDFSFRSSDELIEKIGLLHQQLVEDMTECEKLEILTKSQNHEIDFLETKAMMLAAVTKYSITGRPVKNDKYIGGPLPALPEDSIANNSVGLIDIITSNNALLPDDMYAALDRALMQSKSSDGYDEFSLLTSLSDSIALRVRREYRLPIITHKRKRHSPVDAPLPTIAIEEEVVFDNAPEGQSEIISLPIPDATIGTTSYAMDEDDENIYSREKRLFGIEKELWLDRYLCANRAAISKGRAVMSTLASEREASEDKRDVLAKTSDGKDALELLRTTLEYFKAAESDDPVRQARQNHLKEEYTALLQVMEVKIAEYDSQLAKNLEESQAVFSQNDSFKKEGPYRLTAYLMRTSLIGRAHSWAIVRSGEKWYKILDLEATEIDIEDALGDKSGLMMNAGAYMLFYERSDATESPTIPLSLLKAIDRDNHAFAAELSPDVSADWNLPALESLDYEQIDLGGFVALDDDDDVVDVITMDEPVTISDIGAESQESLGAMDITLDPPLATTTSRYFARPPALEPDTDMDISSSSSSTDVQVPSSADGTTDVLRIRGGASNGAMDLDDDSDEDGQDEDEVELGCLVAMPDNREEWNVDLAVGKVGGKPSWIDPSSPLTYADVACEVCGGYLSFLLQMNSPDDDHAHAAARTLYIFACRAKSCSTLQSSKSIKIFRTQMSSPNAFFPHTTASRLLRQQLEAVLSEKSGLGGELVEGKAEPKCWKESNLVCEPEPYEESYLDEARADATPQAEPTDSEDYAEPDTAVGVDTPFLTFQERVQRLPEQVLRFYRLPGVGDPQPLWISNKKLQADDIEVCSNCQGPRAIEFQILSTMLTHLDDYDFQFDTLLIYTCTASCLLSPRIASTGAEVSGWIQELVVVQTFEAGGVKFGRA